MKLLYKKGDLTAHKKEFSVIAHCVNDVNRMGSGVALALMNRWPEIKSEYHKWGNSGFYLSGKSKVPFVLGQIQLVPVKKNLQVCNLIGQRDITPYEDIPPVRYQSVLEGMKRLKNWMVKNKYNTLAIPRICCGLAGGDWKIIEKILNSSFKDTDFEIIVYDNEPIDGTIYDS